MGFVDNMIKRSRLKSPWIVHFDCGSCNGCDIEVLACLTPMYDVERFGVVNAGNPKHADVLLVSQTVTQKDVHIQNLTNLIELLEAEGLRDKFVVCCGGPRITHELAKELGYDAGFGAGKYADDVASFAVTEMVKRGMK